MNLHDIKLFEVVLRTGNMQRAALKLGITQSAVSKVISKLEKNYELQLLERAPRGVVATVAGQALRERFARVGMAMDDLDRAANNIRSARSGVVRIGVIPSTIQGPLAATLEQILQQQPRIRFKVNVQISDILLEQLEAAELDLAIAAAPLHGPETLVHDVLIGGQMAIVARRDHPLLGKPAQPSALAHERWLLPGPNIGIRQMVEQMYKTHGLGKPDVAVEIDSTPASFLPTIARTQLLTVMRPQTLADSGNTALATWPLDLPNNRTTLGLFRRRTSYLSPAVRQCRDALLTCYSRA